MNCFYHQTVPAVGTCKSCGKGLCPQCAVDLGKGLACAGRCETDAQSIINLIQGNVDRAALHNQIVDTSSKNRYLGASFAIIAGLFFAVSGLFQAHASAFDAYTFFPIGLGGLFFIFGMITLLRAVAAARAAKRR